MNENHSVLGLHALGNDCKIDSKGFMVPNDYIGKVQQSHFFSRMLKKPPKEKLRKKFQSNCWVCDKWIEVHFRWTPRISGEASMAPIYLNLECDDYEPELMIKQKDGSFLLTRVIPPERIRFFFSNKSGTMRSEEFKTHGLINPMRLSYGRRVSMINSCHFQGEVCKIKEPFRSKPRIPSEVYEASKAEYERIPFKIV